MAARVLDANAFGAVWLMLLLLAACGSSDRTSPPPGDAMSPGDAREDDRATDSAGDALDAASSGDAAPCVQQQSGPLPAGAAQSAGFAGTETAYYAVYNVTCSSAGDCSRACVAAGGTMSSCSSGSSCIPTGLDGGSTCLPPTYWLSTSGALGASGSTTSAAELVLVENPYSDALVLTKFQLDVPDGATILGLKFDVRREADDGFAADGEIRAVKNGVAVGTDHGQSGAWPKVLTFQAYGGASDTWGVSWTPADMRSDGFGLSIVPKYTGPSSGNDRAHIDSVKATVVYTTPCD